MSYLDKVSMKSGEGFDKPVQESVPDHYPFNLPVIESLETISLDPRLTFFVGENGSGKSSLLEAIAVGMKCPTIGAIDARSDPMLADARQLSKFLTFSRSSNAKRKMFFRAEDAIGFTRRVQADMKDLAEMEQHFEKKPQGLRENAGNRRGKGSKRRLYLPLR